MILNMFSSAGSAQFTDELSFLCFIALSHDCYPGGRSACCSKACKSSRLDKVLHGSSLERAWRQEERIWPHPRYTHTCQAGQTSETDQCMSFLRQLQQVVRVVNDVRSALSTSLGSLAPAIKTAAHFLQADLPLSTLMKQFHLMLFSILHMIYFSCCRHGARCEWDGHGSVRHSWHDQL